MSSMNAGWLNRVAMPRVRGSERYVVSPREAVAAARARVAADKLRGVRTDPRIVELAQRKAG